MSNLLDYEQQLWQSRITRIAGVDEAGRGPLAGPVVAAAVMFEPGVSIAGVDDSKKLSPAERESLFGQIQTQSIAIGVGIVSPEVIDEINILQATMRAMNDAVSGLDPKPEFLLIDGNFYINRGFPYRTIVKGDSLSFSIAAASIVAKVTRDRLMEDFHSQYPEYGFNRHKGYGTAGHLAAIRTFGRCPIHRKSFHVASIDNHTVAKTLRDESVHA